MQIDLNDATTMLVVLGGGFAVLVMFLLLLTGGDDNAKRSRRRLDKMRDDNVSVVAVGHGSARRHEQHSGIPALDRVLREILPKPDMLRAKLEKTGREISIAEFVLAEILLVALINFLAIWFFGLPPLLVVPAATAAGIYLPFFVINMIGARRIGRFVQNFPEAIDLIVRSVRAGLPISEAINVVGQESPDPVGVEFRKASASMRIGTGLEEALWEIAKRVDVPDFKFFIIAIAIQRETGGNLAETLAGLSATLRKRRQMKLKVRALSSEARASAWIIGSLPFVMFGILLLVNSEYVLQLFQDPRGLVMSGVTLGLIGIGVIVMAKMVRFEI
ncbi:type II secretion system F family protein [Oceanibacterium hippocampi]|uniref:Bacterial type II secretion system protein F domain protein n=1 Tax=Oceanibacterium hippocampi TaxID=745714 RepID=A0A1Y5SB46_9PROT|nr:type II secretion system F family protein [Oceanibacterium hippocampi]SLN36675.1 Bacterial type II secretion system protein F domain protein [Oceanibacterium hippocampi]